MSGAWAEGGLWLGLGMAEVVLVGNTSAGGPGCMTYPQTDHAIFDCNTTQSCYSLHTYIFFCPRHAVSRIAIVKPEKARGVENMILGAAQRGALGAKVGRGPMTVRAAAAAHTHTHTHRQHDPPHVRPCALHGSCGA